MHPLLGRDSPPLSTGGHSLPSSAAAFHIAAVHACAAELPGVECLIRHAVGSGHWRSCFLLFEDREDLLARIAYTSQGVSLDEPSRCCGTLLGISPGDSSQIDRGTNIKGCSLPFTSKNLKFLKLLTKRIF